ncbi:serine hydrolase [Streptococcus phocae subsp. phocae]
MFREKKLIAISGLVSLGLVLLLVVVNIVSTNAIEKKDDQKLAKTSTQVTKKPAHKTFVKSLEAKQAVMDADLARMDSLGLYYDYHKLSLVDTVNAYLQEFGIDPSQIAFSYKNLETGETFAMNETQPMTAGSTYKLPLNMLVVDEVVKGKLSLTERFDITHTDYEYEKEHQAYVSQFSGAMAIPDMQEYSLVYSENTPAYALSERLGGMETAYSKFGRYGKSKGSIPTISIKGNKTTTDYYIQVLDYLWQHQKKYSDVLGYIGRSFPGDYYKTYLPGFDIYQKPGYVREALNVGAIVCEETPYLIALYTAGLGGATEYSHEINALGYRQFVNLTYVINEWHRVNQNKP